MRANRVAIAFLVAIAASAAAQQPTKKSTGTAASASAGWAREPTSFLGMTLGGGFPDDLSDCPILPAGGPDYATMLHGPSCLIKMSDEITSIWKPPSLGFDYSADAFMHEGKIRTIYLKLRSADFAVMRRLLISKYGEPSSTLVASVKTLAGGDFAAEEEHWNGRHVSITLKERDDAVNRAAVYVSDNALVEEVQAEKKQKETAAAAKL
jgi:hypothetical protein